MQKQVITIVAAIIVTIFLSIGLFTFFSYIPAVHANAIWDEDMTDVSNWGTYQATFAANGDGTATLTTAPGQAIGKSFLYVDQYDPELYRTLAVKITTLTGQIAIAISGDSDFAYREMIVATGPGEYTADISTWQDATYTGSLYVQIVVKTIDSDTGTAAAILDELSICTDDCAVSAFRHELVVSGFQAPVDLAVAPDGTLFVAEKAGKLWRVRAGDSGKFELLDLRDEVHSYIDRGLLGITLHPAYPQTPYIYLLYVVDPDTLNGEPPTADTDNQNKITFGRVTRYILTADQQIDPTSRTILLGNDANDGTLHCGPSHAVGAIQFGPDGMLYLSSGDGGLGEFDNGGDPECAAMFGAAEDIGAMRSLNLNNPAGKLLRIDPATGQGLSDNPFYDGDPTTMQSRTWALGLRNPFRFIVTDRGAFIGDVGKEGWEEINLASGGENYQWPCYEGPDPHSLYYNDPATSTACTAPFAGTASPPLMTWHHTEESAIGFTGSAISGLALYDGASFPARYQGALFFADYAEEWLKVAWFNEDNSVATIEDFGQANTVVDIEVDPTTGDLLYVALETSQIRRIRYTDEEAVPLVANANTSLSGGMAPITIPFQSHGSDQAAGEPVALRWDFGDGSSVSTEPHPVHLYEIPGIYTATLVISDTQGNVATDTVRINAENSPPQVQIVEPTILTFDHGDSINFVARASDPDGDQLRYAWQIQQVHKDHIHLLCTSTFASFTCITSADHHQGGEHLTYQAILQVTDAAGLTAEAMVQLVPNAQEPNEPPQANLIATPLACRSPYIVRFDASNSVDTDIDLLRYTWTFGENDATADELSAEIRNAVATTYLYPAAGNYDVMLQVQDSFGSTGIATTTVTFPPPVAAPLRYQERFTDTVTGWRDITTNESFRAYLNNTAGAGVELLLAEQEVWGKVLSDQLMNIDVCQPLVLEVVVREISPEAMLSIGLQEEVPPYQHYPLYSDFTEAGTYVVDLGETLRWIGTQSFSIELIIEGPLGVQKQAILDAVSINLPTTNVPDTFEIYLPLVTRD